MSLIPFVRRATLSQVCHVLLQQCKVFMGSQVIGSLLRMLYHWRQGPSSRLYRVPAPLPCRLAGGDRSPNRCIDSVQFHQLRSPISIQAAPVEFGFRDPISQAYLSQLQTAGGTLTETAGVITAHQIDISLPVGMHRWQGHILEQTLLSDYLLTNPKYVWDLERLPFRRKRGQIPDAVLLTMPWHHNFFHWMVEIMPRLQLYDGIPDLQSLPLIVPQSAPKFVRESLSLAGYDDRTLFLEDGVYRFTQLHLLTRLSVTGDVSPLAIDWLHHVFSPVANRVTFKNPPSKRLYISRRDANIRRVTNEAAVEEVLAPLGFETIVPSEYSLAEQIALFKQAEIVVGSHGAAFANLAFMRPGGVVIECFAPGHFNHAYNRIAQLRQLRYGFLVGQPDRLGFAIDIPALTQLIQQALCQSPLSC
ncbi:MAG: glycosyltransferase family 61 protein [Synechococcales bacterium]|nr:glycosyltransferase family 61 protein [Synechococcales bacterium]